MNRQGIIELSRISMVSDTLLDSNDLKDNEIMLKLNHTCSADAERQWLPAYYFDICYLDGTKIGYCDLRIGYNDKVYVGGNIGYGIDEPYRGHHYAARACLMLFNQAKKHNMKHLTISCQPDNIASERTMQIAGGKFIWVFCDSAITRGRSVFLLIHKDAGKKSCIKSVRFRISLPELWCTQNYKET